MNPREVSEFAKKHKVEVVDLKFVDLLGTWQHFSIPVEELSEGLFKDGSGLDGSSIRGWKADWPPKRSLVGRAASSHGQARAGRRSDPSPAHRSSLPG